LASGVAAGITTISPRRGPSPEVLR
jgi:hypothetical protein